MQLQRRYVVVVIRFMIGGWLLEIFDLVDIC